MENKPTKQAPAESLETASAAPQQPTPAQAPHSFARRLRGLHFGEFRQFYTWLFVLVLLAAAGIIYGTFKWGKQSGVKSGSSQSLSAAQLSSLASNTATVGDAKETLDIQSSSVFEGQVLVKHDLQVAGSIKVGSSVTLPSLTVGGNSSFNQLEVNKTLSVSGNAVVQGQLSVKNGLNVVGSASFAKLSAVQVTLNSLQLNGDLAISRHLSSHGPAPAISRGASLGSGGTVSNSGDDTSGTVRINTGSSPAAGCLASLNFSRQFSTTPHVVISPSNSSASNLRYYTNRSSGSFSICSSNAPSSGASYSFDYIIIG